MPIHFNDRDVVSDITGLSSTLIVTCNMCPAITVAVRENKPFMEITKGILKSPPFEKYLRDLQSRVGKEGIKTKIFRNSLYHQWFLCMWPSGSRKKLHDAAKNFDSIVVLGCESATKTVRDSLGEVDCKVVEGMEVAGIMNATLKFHFPGSVTFENCRVVPISHH
jgi:hypothetical protein